ncbi:TPA: type 1 fimbrial protein, partial [Klebsiella pneumoniae]|nr:type 1 fimbrial protein [Klebsiella pneumoniae]
MHYNERTRSTKLVGFMLSGMLFALTTSVYAGSSSTTVNFSATLVGGSCQISVDRPSITFSPVSSSTVIAAGGDGIDPQLFSMTFSDCSGWGLTPKVQIK